MSQQLPFRAPVEAPITDKTGKLSVQWSIHLQLTAQQLKTPANQAGQHGQFGLNGGFLYVYDQTVGKWIKFAPTAF